MPESTNNRLEFQLLLGASYPLIAMISASSKRRDIKSMYIVGNTAFNIQFTYGIYTAHSIQQVCTIHTYKSILRIDLY